MDFTVEDRDALVTTVEKVGNVEKSIASLNKEMHEGMSTIFNKIDSHNINCATLRESCKKEIKDDLKDYPTKTIFFWIIMIVISSLITLAGFTGRISSDVEVNKTQIRYIMIDRAGE